MKKKYSNIIFDLDGTLLNSEKRNALGLLNILHNKSNKTELTIDDITPKMKRSSISILQDFGVLEEEMDEYLNAWINAVYEESQKPIELFQGVFELLEELNKQSITCGIVSSKSRDIYNIEQEYLNIHDFFTHIVLADDTPYHKPHPAPLLEYLNLSSHQNHDCIYIGDSYSDLICAKDSSINFGLAVWGSSSLFEQEENILRFHSPQDMLDII